MSRWSPVLIHHPTTINVESDQEVKSVRHSRVVQEFKCVGFTGQLNSPFLPDAPNQLFQGLLIHEFQHPFALADSLTRF